MLFFTHIRYTIGLLQPSTHFKSLIYLAHFCNLQLTNRDVGFHLKVLAWLFSNGGSRTTVFSEEVLAWWFSSGGSQTTVQWRGRLSFFCSMLPNVFIIYSLPDVRGWPEFIFFFGKSWREWKVFKWRVSLIFLMVCIS